MSPSKSSARRTASKIQDNPVFSAAARVGYAVNGLLHILIGGIALGIAFGGGGEADQNGALSQVAQAPAGLLVLWAVVIGMLALGLFQLLEAALVRGTDKDAWIDRAKEGGKGIAYLAVGATALQYAMGGSSSGSESSNTVSAMIISSPGGVFILGLLGAGIIAIGVYFVVKGVKKKFMTDIRDPSGKFGDATVIVGVVGYVAKGIAIAVVGLLFVVAAFTTDPDAADGLDGALKSLVQLPFGVVVLSVVALGLIAFGIYSFVRAKYARL